MAAIVQFEEVALDTSQRPTLPRSGHAAATLPAWHDADVIMFGGYVEARDKSRTATDEAWVFSASKGAWEKVVYAAGDVPKGRFATHAVVMNDHLWLIGGWDPSTKGPNASLSDVWKLDLNTYKWTQVVPQGEQLQGISRFQAVALSNSSNILIDTHLSTEDVLVLDTAPSPPTLSKVKVYGGKAPASRGLHSLVEVGSGKLYLFGGASQHGRMMDDLWRLDTASMAWQQLHAKGAVPRERCSHAAAATGQHMLCIGGAYYGSSPGLTMLGDVHVLDVGASQWIVPEVQGRVPCPRNAAVMVPLPLRGPGNGQQMLLHGGWKAFQETYNDTFLVTFTAQGAS